MRVGNCAVFISVLTAASWFVPAMADPAVHGPAAAAAAAAAAAQADAAKEAATEANKQPSPSPATVESQSETAAAPAPKPVPAERPSAQSEPGPAPDASVDAEESPEALAAAQPESFPDPKKKPKVIAAKRLFGAAKVGAPLKSRAIGWYSKGCLAGAMRLPDNGPNWQAMRLSRNRHWAHPKLVKLLKRFASEVHEDGWPGLLVGDLSQPRGGPMLSGHASHQVGLDADIWLTPMPDRRLTRKERENISAISMLSKKNSLKVDPNIWTDSRFKIIKRMASYDAVERVLVHPAIKKAICDASTQDDWRWRNKIRPYWGHHYHFHVRIGCPSGSNNCRSQSPAPKGNTCTSELDYWFDVMKPKPKPKKKIAKPSKPKKKRKAKLPMMLKDLPNDCRDVLAATPETKDNVAGN